MKFHFPEFAKTIEAKTKDEAIELLKKSGDKPEKSVGKKAAVPKVSKLDKEEE